MAKPKIQNPIKSKGVKQVKKVETVKKKKVGQRKQGQEVSQIDTKNAESFREVDLNPRLLLGKKGKLIDEETRDYVLHMVDGVMSEVLGMLHKNRMSGEMSAEMKTFRTEISEGMENILVTSKGSKIRQLFKEQNDHKSILTRLQEQIVLTEHNKEKLDGQLEDAKETLQKLEAAEVDTDQQQLHPLLIGTLTLPLSSK